MDDRRKIAEEIGDSTELDGALGQKGAEIDGIIPAQWGVGSARTCGLDGADDRERGKVVIEMGEGIWSRPEMRARWGTLERGGTRGGEESIDLGRGGGFDLDMDMDTGGLVLPETGHVENPHDAGELIASVGT
jgi:hypothetical protein